MRLAFLATWLASIGRLSALEIQLDDHRVFSLPQFRIGASF